MSERKEGWYWIKSNHAALWECMQWNGAAWCCSNAASSPAIIGDYIPTPDEPWQSVPKEATPDMREVQTLSNEVIAVRRWRDTLAVAPKPGDV